MKILILTKRDRAILAALPGSIAEICARAGPAYHVSNIHLAISTLRRYGYIDVSWRLIGPGEDECIYARRKIKSPSD